MSSRYDNPFWQLRDLQRALDALKPQLDLAQTIPREIQEQLEQFRLLEEQFTLPSDYLSSIREVQRLLGSGAALEGLPALARVDLPFLEEMRRQQELVDSARGQFADLELRQPVSIAAFEALAPVEALLETSRIGACEVKAILRPFQAFQEFAARQVELAGSVSASSVLETRLEVISESTELLDCMVKGFELGALIRHDFPPTEAEPEPDARLSDLYASSNLFIRLEQRSEEADIEADDFDVEEFVLESCEGRLSESGYRLVKLVRDINVEAELEGKRPPFKPTTNTLYACGALPAIIAQDEVSFHTIVDQLYFLLYEGSGSAKRLVEAYGEDGLDALWRLKHLRLAARHDVDHGSASDIRAKRGNIGAAFKELIGLVFPKEVGDWCRAQLTLYEQLIEMLENLWLNEDTDTEDSEPTAGEDG